MRILLDVMRLVVLLLASIAIIFGIVLELMGIRKIKSELLEEREEKESASDRRQKPETEKPEKKNQNIREQVAENIKEVYKEEEVQRHFAPKDEKEKMLSLETPDCTGNKVQEKYMKNEAISFGTRNQNRKEEDKRVKTAIVLEDKEKKMLPMVVDQNPKRDGGDNREIILQKEYDGQAILNFIRNEDKEKYIKIGTPSIKENVSRFTEMEEGKMVVYLQDGERYIVVPIRDCIGEKEYQFSALHICYEVSENIQQESYYDVAAVEKVCIMEKKGDSYQVVQKGYLRIRKI